MKQENLEQCRSRLQKILESHKPYYLDRSLKDLLPKSCQGSLLNKKLTKWIQLVLLTIFILFGVKYYYEEMQGKVVSFCEQK